MKKKKRLSLRKKMEIQVMAIKNVKTSILVTATVLSGDTCAFFTAIELINDESITVLKNL